MNYVAIAAFAIGMILGMLIEKAISYRLHKSIVETASGLADSSLLQAKLNEDLLTNNERAINALVSVVAAYKSSLGLGEE